MEITFDAIENKYSRQIPKHLKPQVDDLRDLLSVDPAAAIDKILIVLEKYPDLALLRNYLCAAYSMTGQDEKAEILAEENYRKFPDYLFAKTHYAQICCSKGKMNLVPAIFDYQYDLQALYPRRKQFHFSEVITFMGVMVVYFHMIGEERTARSYYGIMKKIDKNHPMTRQVKRRLYPSILTRIIRILVVSKEFVRFLSEAKTR